MEQGSGCRIQKLYFYSPQSRFRKSYANWGCKSGCQQLCVEFIKEISQLIHGKKLKLANTFLGKPELSR